MRVVVLHEASEELSDAATWYEQERAGLGADLLAEASRAVKEIAASPTTWPFVPRSRVVRRFLLTRFPFVAYYVVHDDQAATCLCFAVASFALAELGEHAPVHYARALDVAELGAEARMDVTRAKPDLRVVRMVARELLAGRRPTVDASYRAGRGLHRALEPLPHAA